MDWYYAYKLQTASGIHYVAIKTGPLKPVGITSSK